MKRLLILPAVAATAAALYLSGLAWPILTTAASLIGRRPTNPFDERPTYEPDVLA